jgi:hypothetical protein
MPVDDGVLRAARLLSGPNACSRKSFDGVKLGGIRHNGYFIAVMDADLLEMAIDERLVLMVREEIKVRKPDSGPLLKRAVTVAGSRGKP